MTTAIIEVTAPTGAGKTTLQRIIATALMQIDGVERVSDITHIRRPIGRNPLERFSIEYDVQKVSKDGSRWCRAQEYVWVGSNQVRAQNAIYEEQRKPTAAVTVVETKGIWSLGHVGLFIHCVTEERGGTEPHVVFASVDHQAARGFFESLQTAYGKGLDHATDKAYDLGVQAGFDRGTAAGKALAPAHVVVTNNSGHAVTFEPAPNNAGAAQTYTLGVAMEKGVASQGAPLAADSAHINWPDPAIASGPSKAWNDSPSGSPGWSNGDGWKHVTDHTPPYWPNEGTKVDVHYEKSKRTRNNVLATDINWFDATITHWRFTPNTQL